MQLAVTLAISLNFPIVLTNDASDRTISNFAADEICSYASFNTEFRKRAKFSHTDS